MKMGVAGTFFETHLWNSENLLLFSRFKNHISITFWIFWIYKSFKKMLEPSSLGVQSFLLSPIRVPGVWIRTLRWYIGDNTNDNSYLQKSGKSNQNRPPESLDGRSFINIYQCLGKNNRTIYHFIQIHLSLSHWRQ